MAGGARVASLTGRKAILVALSNTISSCLVLYCLLVRGRRERARSKRRQSRERASEARSAH